MFLFCILVYWVTLFSSLGADWRFEALDSSFVVLKGDYSADEQQKFQCPDVAPRGWRFDKAFEEAAQTVFDERMSREMALKSGPIRSSIAIEKRGFWKQPIGVIRFRNDLGQFQAVKMHG